MELLDGYREWRGASNGGAQGHKHLCALGREVDFLDTSASVITLYVCAHHAHESDVHDVLAEEVAMCEVSPHSVPALLAHLHGYVRLQRTLCHAAWHTANVASAVNLPL